MLENVLFLINIPKIAVRARRSVIVHQTLAFVTFLCWNFALLLSNFCWWGCKVWFCPQAPGTLATLLILTLLFFWSCVITIYGA